MPSKVECCTGRVNPRGLQVPAFPGQVRDPLFVLVGGGRGLGGYARRLRVMSLRARERFLKFLRVWGGFKFCGSLTGADKNFHPRWTLIQRQRNQILLLYHLFHMNDWVISPLPHTLISNYGRFRRCFKEQKHPLRQRKGSFVIGYSFCTPNLGYDERCAGAHLRLLCAFGQSATATYYWARLLKLFCSATPLQKWIFYAAPLIYCRESRR